MISAQFFFSEKIPNAPESTFTQILFLKLYLKFEILQSKNKYCVLSNATNYCSFNAKLELMHSLFVFVKNGGTVSKLHAIKIQNFGVKYSVIYYTKSKFCYKNF